MSVLKQIKRGVACSLIMAMALTSLELPALATPAMDSPEDANINYMRLKNHQGPSGVPLGGTGVGYYEISPEGKFTRNCINNIHKSFVDSPDGMFLATWQDGHAARLQRDGDTSYGMQGYSDSYYTGLFPRLELDFENAKNENVANASFKANSGVVAQNIKDSSLPVAWYEVELTNDSDVEKEMSVLFSWADLIGRGIRDTTSYDQPGFNVDGESGSWFYMAPPKTYAKDVVVDGWKGVLQTTGGQKMVPNKATFQNYNTDFMILSKEEEGTTVTTLKNYTLGDQNALQSFVQNGSLDAATEEVVPLSDGSGAANRPTNASAVAVETTVPALQTKTVRFMVAWYMPEFTADDIARISSKGENCDYNKYYHNFAASITDVAQYAIDNGDSIYEGVMEWQQPILDSNMPEWLQFKQINSAYTLFSNGVLNKRCNFTTLEGEMGGYGGTMDQKMSSHPMYEKLFPQLNLNENRQFANTPAANGEIQHFDVHYYVGISDFDPNNTYNPTPNGSMIDNSGAWMVQMLNYYRQTGDDTYLKLYYDRMKASMAFMVTKFMEGTQIPNYNTTYDDYSHPQILIFSGTVYLNMLEIAQEFARVNQDAAQAAVYKAQYDKTYADVEKLYVTDKGDVPFYAFGSNREYIASNKAEGEILSDIMFSGAMAGQFMSRYSGTGDIVPFENYVSHMQKFLLTSVQGSNDYFAAKVYNWATGQKLDNGGSQCWPFYLDSYGGMGAIQAGYVEDGMEILEHTQLVNFRQGYTWTQNLWNPGYSTYMTAPVVWFVNDVLAGSAVDVPAKTLTLGPTTIPDTNKLEVPLYYPKYWAKLTYDQTSGTASYEITKTFYAPNEEPIVFENLCIAPNGTATDAATTHQINFTVREGQTLDLSAFKDELAGNVAREKLLEPVNKYGSNSSVKLASGTGLTASYFKGLSTDKADLVKTEVAPKIDDTWNAGESPEGLGDQEAYTIKYEGSILPRYGQTYELRFLLRGEEDDMELVFNGRKVATDEFAHEYTNGNIEVPEGCTLNVFTVDLAASELYPIEITYKNKNAAAGGMMHLMWWSTLQTPDYIIRERLYPVQSAYETIPAINYSKKYGNITQREDYMEYVERDNWLLFPAVDFGDGMTGGSVSILAGAPEEDVSRGGTVEVRKGSHDGELISTIQFTPTGGWNDMQSFSGNISLSQPLSGKQDICLVFHPNANFLFNLSSFVFSGESLVSRFAYHDMQASTFDEKGGRVQPSGDSSNIEYIEKNDWTAYKGVEFGGGIKKGSIILEAAVAESDNCKNGIVEVRTGAQDGPVLTTVNITPTDGWGDYRGFTGEFELDEAIAGQQDIYLVFQPELTFLGNVRAFKFVPSGSAFDPITAVEYSDKGGRIGPKGDNSCIEYIEDNNWVTYCGLDFSESFSKGKIAIEAAALSDPNNAGGTVEVRRDSINGELMGTVTITNTNGWEDFRSFEGNVNLTEPLSGRVDICLLFKPVLKFVGNVRSFNFMRNAAHTRAVTCTLTNLTGNAPTEVGDGEALSFTLTAASGYDLPERITVTMGGTTLAADTGYTYTKATGEVKIAAVTGDVAVTAAGVAQITDSATPTITTQPSSQTVDEGMAATFTVAAAVTDGGKLSYQWEQSADNGAAWKAILDATEGVYTIEETALTDSGLKFRCVITNTNTGKNPKSVTTNDVLLTVAGEVTERYTVTALGGTLAGGGTTGAFRPGDEVTVTADSPAAGETFRDWAPVGLELTDATRQTITFDMPDHNVTMRARWDGKQGVNPLLPLDEFIPDVEAQVFTGADGVERVYLYGSHDNYPPSSWCSKQYRVYSSPTDDLTHWTDHGVSFASTGDQGYSWTDPKTGEVTTDGISWSNAELYAPDVEYHDGKYWLVSCLSGGGLGMSYSDVPEGPFSSAKQVKYDDAGQTPLGSIDPSLFSENGTLYLVWGQMKGWGEGCVGVELEQDADGFYSVAKSATKSFLFGTEENPDTGFGFYEGPSMGKLDNGQYYIYYPSNKGKGVHAMCYATSDTPLGQYTYRGIIIDPDGCDNEGGNSHGSLLKVDDQWYAVYHRGFNGNMSRKVCVEPITVDKDGGIATVPMTNHGFGGPLEPYQKVEAAYATHVRLDGFKGGCHFDELAPDLHPLVNITNGNCVEYKDFDFGAAEKPLSFTANLRPKAGGTIELVLDDPTAKPIGVLAVPAATGNDWVEISAPMSQRVAGVHTLFLRFKGGTNANICELASFRFGELSALFADDFSGDLANWKNTTGASIADGILTLTGNTGFEAQNGAAWGDYTLLADVTPKTGAAGIALRKTDGRNYYLVELAENGASLSRVAAGRKTVLTTAETGIRANETYSVQVDSVGETLRVYIDGALVLSARDGYLRGGTIGFVQPVDTSASFDNVLVALTTAARQDSITINGEPLENFSSATKVYEFKVKTDAAIPVVMARSTDSGVGVAVTQAAQLPGDATVTFTAGTDAQTYTIRFLTSMQAKTDHFDGDAIADSWRVTNPNPANVEYVKGTGLTITSEPGDLGGSVEAKNVYLQPTEGDWSFETVLRMDKGSYGGYPQAGVTVYESNTNLIKLVWMNGTIEGKNNGKQFVYQTGVTLNAGDPLYMRAKKSDNQYTFSYSTDGTAYNDLPVQAFDAEQVNVGLAAFSSNAGGSESLKATFGYFKFRENVPQTDLFDGDTYGDFWSVDRPDLSKVTYTKGTGLSITSVEGDVNKAQNPVNTFLQSASGDWVVETALTANPAFGSVGGWPSGGLVVRSGEQFIKLVCLNGGVEFNTHDGIKEQPGLSLTDPSQVLKLRLTKKGTTYAGEYSTDGGTTWLTFSKTRTLPAYEVQVGLMAVGWSGVTQTVTFHSFTAQKDEVFLPDPVPVTGVELSEPKLELEVGDTAALAVSILPDTASVRDVIWSVESGDGFISLGSGPNSPTMLIKALAEGTAIVRATSVADPSLYAECAVQVTEPVEPTEYTVTFKADGEVIGTRTVDEGDTLSVAEFPAVPVKTGHDGTWDVTEDIVNITGNKTVNAVYTLQEYTVALDVNGGAGVDPDALTVTYGGAYGTLPAPTYADETKRFDGWYTEAEGGALVTGATIVTATVNHTLYAHWRDQDVSAAPDDTVSGMPDKVILPCEEDVTLTVTVRDTYTKYQWQINTGEDWEDLDGADEHAYTIPAEGLTIQSDGWQYQCIITNKEPGRADAISTGTPVTLHVEETPAVQQHTVTFDSNGGSEIASVTAEDGAAVTKPADPTRSGYDFVGWYSDEALTVAYDFATPVTGDMTLYAKWEQEPEEPSYNPPSNTMTKTEKNPDGSTTKTVTNKRTGDVTATTIYPDGTKIVATTPKDGETGIAVTVPKNKETVTVTIPTEKKPGPGNVVVIIHEDGTREIVKTSIPTEAGMKVLLSESCKLAFVDNSKDFADVENADWFHGAVQFVAAREIFTGTGEISFSPLGSTTRGMLFTVLARLDGQDTTGGEAWYSKGLNWAREAGLSDGTHPEENITREQLVTMLYRYAGSPEADEERRVKDAAPYGEFEDVAIVSDWAADAMNWAVENGILRGSGDKLNPGGSATRAEVAAMLQRFLCIT